MKIVLDTNVLLASLRRGGKLRPIFDAIRQGTVSLAVTTEILLEYEEIIGKRINRHVAANVMGLLLSLRRSEMMIVYFRFDLLKVDPDDNKFADCAVAAGADFIVSNDRHFHALRRVEFPRIKVINADDFIALLARL